MLSLNIPDIVFILILSDLFLTEFLIFFLINVKLSFLNISESVSIDSNNWLVIYWINLKIGLFIKLSWIFLIFKSINWFILLFLIYLECGL